jgi:phosphotriesterase-related protein
MIAAAADADATTPVSAGYVRTVTGVIPAEQLGGTLMHEHVASLIPGEDAGSYLSGGRENDRLELAIRALAPLRDAGINTVVNLSGATHLGKAWPWPFLQEVSRRSGINIVAGFAYYTERVWPPGIAQLSLDDLAETFIEATDHISTSTVGAGVYGEVGTGFNAISEGEERCLRAVAMAQRQTGLAIMTHASLGTMIPEQVEILATAGADLEQVVIGHADLKPEVDYLEGALRRGVTIAFDTIGKERFDYILGRQESYEPENTLKRAYLRADEERLETLVALIRNGWAGQIVLSSDMSGLEAFFNPTTHGLYGYTFIPDVVMPELRRRGVSEDTLHQITVQNPRTMLTIRDH